MRKIKLGVICLLVLISLTGCESESLNDKLVSALKDNGFINKDASYVSTSNQLNGDNVTKYYIYKVNGDYVAIKIDETNNDCKYTVSVTYNVLASYEEVGSYDKNSKTTKSGSKIIYDITPSGSDSNYCMNESKGFLGMGKSISVTKK